eukprot:ANDGO_08134.mRNA.1 GTPase-activating protein
MQQRPGQRQLLQETRDISSLTKATYKLRSRLRELELKIRLIVWNLYRETLPQSSLQLKKDDAVVVLPEQLLAYESLVALFRCDVKYLAILTAKAKSSDIDPLLQLVVLTLFGNQFSPSEEKKLLELFQKLLQGEYANCKNIGEFMRSNSAFTKMLTVFANRPSFRKYMVDVLQPVVQEVSNDSSMNLELKPSKLFVELYGSVGTVPEDSVAMEDEKVRRLQNPRIEKIISLSSRLLDRFFNSVSEMPFGLRCVCSRIFEEGRTKFPSSVSDSTILTLVGGFLFLRVATPLIVSPKSLLGDREALLTANQRKSLLMVAKVVQNLSNGVFFGEKEEFMVPLNAFLTSYRPKFEAFLKSVCTISAESLKKSEADAWLGTAMESHEVSVDVSFSELRMLHSMCLELETDLCSLDGNTPKVSLIISLLKKFSVPPNTQDNVALRLFQIAGAVSEADGGPQLSDPQVEKFLSEKADAVMKVLQDCRKEYGSLEQKVLLYEEYLQNVRSKDSYIRTQSEAKTKFTLDQLVKDHIVLSHDIPNDFIRSKLVRVVLLNPEPGVVAVSVRAGPAKLHELKVFLDDLLEWRASGNQLLKMEVEGHSVCLSLDNLIGLWNRLYLQRR